MIKVEGLNEADRSFIFNTYSNKNIPWDSRMAIIMSRYGICERTVRRWIRKLGFSKDCTVREEPDVLRNARRRALGPRSNYFIVTCAQNATPVHKDFFDNILAYASHLGAEVHVVPIRYRNPTSIFVDRVDDWWDVRLVPYLTLGRLHLHSRVTLAADVKIQPTTENPLSGFEGLTGDASTILAHPRVHLTSLPVLGDGLIKLLMTTGCVTVPNYTDSKAGKKGEFHHTYGFVVVEVRDSDVAFVRQVTACPDGSFMDILNSVSDGAVTPLCGVEAYVMGDLHSSEKDVEFFDAVVRYLEVLKPRNVVLHDVFSGKSISHHDRRSPTRMYHKYVSGEAFLKAELEATFADVERLLPYNPVIVYSNHHLWLDRWVDEQDWRREVHNSVLYMNMAMALLSGQAKDGLFPYLVRERFGDSVRCLGVNESYKIQGWELGNHGHLGPHGSKGSIERFRKFNTKVITGDSHVAHRRDGALSVGTHSKLRLGYNDGPSAWSHTDVIIHPNGKAQHLIFFNNEFTTLL